MRLREFIVLWALKNAGTAGECFPGLYSGDYYDCFENPDFVGFETSTTTSTEVPTTKTLQVN